VASKWKVNQPFVARKSMQDITLEVILQTIFGLSEGERYQEIKSLTAATLDTTNSPITSSILFFKFLQQDWGGLSPWGKMMQRRKELYSLLQAEIEKKRDRLELLGNDILSLMLSAKDENGQPMSDEELKDELMTLLLAGHETTATSLAWAFYWLNKIPEIKEKLLQEIDSLGNNPDPMDVAQLPYLNAVCQETLRIYPVVLTAAFRLSKSAIEIMGYQLESKTFVVPSIYLVHHREDIYPEAKQFKPERFLERQYSPYEFIPFGGGNRRCLGYTLAMLEMKLVLATVLSHYDLKLANNNPVKPQRRGVTIAPHNGVPLVMTRKREQQKQTADLMARTTK
jgi:cytochrome P450 family 110